MNHTYRMASSSSKTKGWAQARRDWASGALSPWERVVAVVAAGQLMRVGLEATGALGATPTQTPDSKRSLTFFTVSETDAHLVPQAEAIREFKARLFAKK